MSKSQTNRRFRDGFISLRLSVADLHYKHGLVKVKREVLAGGREKHSSATVQSQALLSSAGLNLHLQGNNADVHTLTEGD